MGDYNKGLLKLIGFAKRKSIERFDSIKSEPSKIILDLAIRLKRENLCFIKFHLDQY